MSFGEMNFFQYFAFLRVKFFETEFDTKIYFN